MKIIELCGLSRGSGGLFYAVSSLCKAMAADGLELTAVGVQDAYTQEDLPAWAPVPVVDCKGVGPLQYSEGVRSGLRLREPELVHLHGLWLDAQWAALQWQRRSGRPVVVSPHGMLDPWALKNSAWKKRLVGAIFADELLRRASCIHALCRSEAEAIRAYGLKNPIAVIPNGVELPEIRDQKSEVGGQKTLLYLGRIHPKKGLVELLTAWGRFPKDWKLVVAGWDDGGHEAGLRALAGERVEFVGPKHGAEKEQLFRDADAFILPSFSEGLPVSVLEAWSYQLPVVMTPFCNLPEGFTAGAAIEVQPDADSIFPGLEKLAALSTAERMAMGAKGRTLVEEKFAWRGIAENMRQVYDWCAGGGDAPACVEFF